MTVFSTYWFTCCFAQAINMFNCVLDKGRPNHHDKYGNMQLQMHWINGMHNLKVTLLH